MTNGLLRVEEVEAMLACGRDTIFRLFRTGELASFKVGRRRLIRREDIDALIEARIEAERVAAAR